LPLKIQSVFSLLQQCALVNVEGIHEKNPHPPCAFGFAG
jgi:hypothetical protein